MSRTIEQYHRDVISRAENGAAAAMLRGILGIAEPFYRAAVAARNSLYSRGTFAAHSAGRPVISVGNITTGGTGKTPVVRWLVEQLLAVGQRPAVLMRGYKGGDEQRMLQAQLPNVMIQANSSRLRGAQQVLAAQSDVTVFVLDDGFQHRRLRRDFDVVLLDASNPFGFEHVLPRGLLREPLAELARADAFLITHCETGQPAAVENELRRHNPTAPISRCEHVLVGLPELRGVKVFTFCGIGNPAVFERQIESAGAILAGTHRFGDHHPYTPGDVEMLRRRCSEAGGEMLITTEKDWVKLAALGCDLAKMHKAELAIRFSTGDEVLLLDKITAAIASPRAAVEA